MADASVNLHGFELLAAVEVHGCANVVITGCGRAIYSCRYFGGTLQAYPYTLDGGI
ncbi:hypothetical protein [Shewanella psychrotolerans]|uniref:hypothetical protein n=1 Tax=Shewanella psychrotolerans TaxID=2864206 RepID=UPI001C659237|nr:hypothetical protein [Shewanella psychrotolerans]QYK00159.1 hypothetical protein K0I62_12015 [Shewanella psychrotolerans]